MSSSEGDLSASRPSNGSYPASDGSAAILSDSEKRPDVPTVEERVNGILAAYPERTMRPVSETHGQKLREEALYDPETVEREVDVGGGESMMVSDEVERPARCLADVLERFLEDHERYRDMKLRMVRGRSDKGDREEFLVDLENSFSSGYQEKQYARLKALERMLIGEPGEESPTGEEYPGMFEESVTVLFGLTASSLRGGDFVPIVDHDRSIREAWSGSDGVRRTLRYVLQDKLGLDSSDYAWWFQSEPHPGGGDAAGYSHAHPVVVLDAAAADVSLDELDAETFRPVVAKHVSECEGAEWDAHRVRKESEKSAVKVKKPDEIQSLAGYLSEYIGVDPGTDLMERSDEYLMYSASQWASSTQKYSKSRTATAAIDADRCHQEYADDEAGQEFDHGEKVVRSDRPGVEYECAGCGSEFCVDQSPDTLVEARRVSDGGVGGSSEREPVVREVDFEHSEVVEVSVRSEASESGGVPETLRGKWPSADEAASVGGSTVERECEHTDGSAECPLCCPDGERVDASVSIPPGAEPPESVPYEVESFGRVPQWNAEAVVWEWSDEEKIIDRPGGAVYEEVVVEGADAIPPEKLIPPDKLRTPEPDVDPTEYPPPELIERQLAEVHHGDRITAKTWPDDWHEQRYSEESSGGEVESVPWEPVKQYREDNPGASVSKLVDLFDIPESKRTVVGGVLGPPS